MIWEKIDPIDPCPSQPGVLKYRIFILRITDMCFFFSIWFFFHNHSRITGLQMKGEGISLTPHYYFHTLHSHLDISREITAESLPLHIGSSHSKREPLVSKHKSLTTKLRAIKFLTSNLYHQSLGPCQVCMIPTSIYMFKINNRYTRKRCEVYSKLTKKHQNDANDIIVVFL